MVVLETRLFFDRPRGVPRLKISLRALLKVLATFRRGRGEGFWGVSMRMPIRMLETCTTASYVNIGVDQEVFGFCGLTGASGS